jgi:pyrrolidone-carboxylate peptidase
MGRSARPSGDPIPRINTRGTLSLQRQQEGYHTQSAFIHLPLAPEQAAQSHQREPSMHTELAADGIRRIVDWMVRMETPASGDLRTL